MQLHCLLQNPIISDNSFLFWDHSIFGSEVGYPRCLCLNWLLVADEHFSVLLSPMCRSSKWSLPFLFPQPRSFQKWHMPCLADTWFDQSNNIAFKPYWRKCIFSLTIIQFLKLIFVARDKCKIVQMSNTVFLKLFRKYT